MHIWHALARTFTSWRTGPRARSVAMPSRLASTPLFDPKAPGIVPDPLAVARAEWRTIRHANPSITSREFISTLHRLNAEADRQIRTLEAELARLTQPEN